MKKIILFLLLTGFVFSLSFAQETESEEPASYPVTAFESPYLVDDQTTMVADKKTLGFAIQHKFASVENGISDLFGMYGPGTNIRLALDYVPLKNLQLGAGISKGKMLSDLNAKYLILQQTDDNKMPVSVAVYGVLGIDGREQDAFGTGQIVTTKGEDLPETVKFNDRISYFSQLMISRKFTEWLSVQGGASFTHYNLANWDDNHDLIGLHALGRIKISPQSSITVNYNAPLKIQNISEQTVIPNYKPNMAIGWQISTFTHAFQLYVSNAPSMIPQENMMYNRAGFDKSGIAIGFTITRLWAF
ncbi:MAG: DUF5777 family beta-barrel protein [Draconibacterium sp.]